MLLGLHKNSPADHAATNTWRGFTRSLQQKSYTSYHICSTIYSENVHSKLWIMFHAQDCFSHFSYNIQCHNQTTCVCAKTKVPTGYERQIMGNSNPRGLLIYISSNFVRLCINRNIGLFAKLWLIDCILGLDWHTIHWKYQYSAFIVYSFLAAIFVFE